MEKEKENTITISDEDLEQENENKDVVIEFKESNFLDQWVEEETKLEEKQRLNKDDESNISSDFANQFKEIEEEEEEEETEKSNEVKFTEKITDSISDFDKEDCEMFASILIEGLDWLICSGLMAWGGDSSKNEIPYSASAVRKKRMSVLLTAFFVRMEKKFDIKFVIVAVFIMMYITPAKNAYKKRKENADKKRKLVAQNYNESKVIIPPVSTIKTIKKESDTNYPTAVNIPFSEISKKMDVIHREAESSKLVKLQNSDKESKKNSDNRFDDVLILIGNE